MHSRTKTAETTLWGTVEDRRRARDEKREAVLRMAIQLFLAQGYHRTTLNDVAERLNITKPALYNYFRSKEEILFACYQPGLEMIAAQLDRIVAEGGSGLDRLRKLIRAYAGAMMTEFGMSLVRLDDRELSPSAFETVRTDKRKFDTAFRTFIEEGIVDGSITACDPKLAAFAIAGSLNWIGHWYEPEGEVAAAAIAQEFSRQLTEGLVSKRRRMIRKPANKA
jgi:AcrR family transcriptional regulator